MCFLARFFFHILFIIPSLNHNLFFLYDILCIFLLSGYLYFIQKSLWIAIGKTWFFNSGNISQEGLIWIKAFLGDNYLSKHIAFDNIDFYKKQRTSSWL